MKFLTLVALLPLALAAGEPSPPPTPATSPTQGAAPAAAKSAHVMYDAAQLKWGEPPPALERGAQAVVLSGNPSSPGPFVLRLKAPPGYRVATHWHPTDEQVTVLEGDLTLTMNAHGPDEHAHTFAPGGYALLPAQMHHAASTRRGATLQISGMGPFELNYVDPKDDPRLRASTK